jgi:hypothetical protein
MMIENQSCGEFSREREKSLVRHYPYFLGEDNPSSPRFDAAARQVKAGLLN